jgi:hypothetical protein
MIISDLNYLESAEVSGVLGGGVDAKVKFDKKIDIMEKIKIDIDKKINAKSDVKGNQAFSEAAADAYGKDSFTETLTVSEVYEDLSSGSYSSSVAAA